MRQLPPKSFALAVIREGDSNDCTVYDTVFPCRGRRDAVERLAESLLSSFVPAVRDDVQDDCNELPTFFYDVPCTDDDDCQDDDACESGETLWIGIESVRLYRTREDAEAGRAYYHSRWHVQTPWDRKGGAQ